MISPIRLATASRAEGPLLVRVRFKGSFEGLNRVQQGVLNFKVLLLLWFCQRGGLVVKVLPELRDYGSQT